MIDDEQIAKLEALLARVRSRSRAPKAPQPPRPAARASSLEVPTPVAGFFPSSIPPPPQPAAAPVPIAPLPPARPKHASRPEVPASLLAFGPPESSRVRGIEPPPMEVIELEVDPDPSIPPPPVSGTLMEAFGAPYPDGPSGSLPVEEALESRSRLVSAPPLPLEPLDVGDEPPGHAPSDPTIEVAAAEVSRAELEALEADRAPTSSRRPISMEEKMNELDDVVPLHTPPPESGRLPAATPAFDLGFEPEPAPHVVRAEPDPGADVAVFVGGPPGTSDVKTFGELLDDALSL